MYAEENTIDRVVHWSIELLQKHRKCFIKFFLRAIIWLLLRYPYLMFNPLSANPTKWSNTLKQFVGKLLTNCLSVLNLLWGWSFKGWRYHKVIWAIHEIYWKIKNKDTTKTLSATLIYNFYSVLHNVIVLFSFTLSMFLPRGTLLNSQNTRSL